MFYVMYIYYAGAHQDLIRLVLDYFHTQSYAEGDDELVAVCTEGFTLRISDASQGIKYTSEDYSIESNLCFWFDIITSHADWAEDMLRFVDHLLVNTSGDVVIESNADTPILLRKSGSTFIHRNYGNGQFPFDLITISCEDKRLERDWKE